MTNFCGVKKRVEGEWEYIFENQQSCFNSIDLDGARKNELDCTLIFLYLFGFLGFWYFGVVRLIY